MFLYIISRYSNNLYLSSKNYLSRNLQPLLTLLNSLSFFFFLFSLQIPPSIYTRLLVISILSVYSLSFVFVRLIKHPFRSHPEGPRSFPSLLRSISGASPRARYIN